MALPGGAYQGSTFGTVQGNVMIPELWSSEIKRKRDTSFVVSQSCRKLPMVGKKGDLIHIPEVYRLAINDKIHDTPVTLQNRTSTEYTIVVDKYKEVSFAIEDIINIQADYSLRQEYTREAGYAMARDIDNFLLGLRATIQGYNSQSNVIYNTSDGTSSGTPLALSRAAILAAMQILDEADVPQEGRKWFIAPGQRTDLLTIQEFISADYVNNSPTTTGTIGSLYGIPVYVSNNIKANTTTGYTNGDGSGAQPTPGVTNSPYFPTQSVTHFGTAITNTTLVTTGSMVTAMLCHPDWAMLAMQLNPKVESSRENLLQADAVVCTQVYGAKVFRPDHAVLVYTAA